MANYKAPVVTELGSVQDLTQQNYHKTGTGTDAIYVHGNLVSGPNEGGDTLVQGSN